MARKSLKNVARLLSSINENVSIQEQFLHDLIKSIEKTDNANARKPSQTYKPSSMNCMRMSYYQVKGIEPDISNSEYSMVGVGESGTDRHIRIQKAITEMKTNGYDCEYIDVADFIQKKGLIDLEIKEKSGMETKIYNKKLNMSFMTDGIIKYKGKYYIFEFKTEIDKKWFSRMTVDPNHYHQGIAYALNFELNNVLFLYENRNTCQKKCYLFEVTDNMKQDILGYISNCDLYIKNNEVPEKVLNNKLCNYCSYKGQCKKDG